MWLALCGFGLITLLLRATSLHQPPDTDTGIYALFGHELHSGAVFYKDFWELKPPGTIWLYALAETIFGYRETQIFALGLAAALLTLVGIYFAGRELGGNVTGAAAALFWTFLSGDVRLQADQPNVEVFINCCLVWYLAIFLRVLRTEKPILSTLHAIALGLIVAASTLFKQFTLVTYILIPLSLLSLAPRDRADKPKLLRALLIAGVTFAAAWGAVLFNLHLTGSLEGFQFVLTKLGKAYAGSPLHNLITGLRPKHSFGKALPLIRPLLFLSILGLCLSWRSKEHRPAFAVVLALIFATYLNVCMPGKFFTHYFQLWLPVMCLGGAWGMVRLSEHWSSPRLQPAAVQGICLLVLGSVFLFSAVQGGVLSGWQRSWAKYGPRYVQAREVGLEAATVLAPEDRLYVWGKENAVYMYAQRRPASNVDMTGLLAEKRLFPTGIPHLAQFQQRFLQDMEATKPPLIVGYRDNPREGAAYRYVEQHYTPLPITPWRHDYLYLIRKGSRLEAQTRHGWPGA